MDTLISRLRSLPRAGRWSLLAGAVLLAYFAVVEPVIDATNRMNQRADILADRLEEAAALREGDQIRETIVRSFGTPSLPSSDPRRRARLQAAVDTILGESGVSANERSERMAPIRGAEAGRLVGPGERLERLEMTLRFEATPETVNMVVQRLEADEIVTAVTRVRLDRRAHGDAPDRLVNATIGLETWILDPTRGGRR